MAFYFWEAPEVRKALKDGLFCPRGQVVFGPVALLLPRSATGMSFMQACATLPRNGMLSKSRQI